MTATIRVDNQPEGLAVDRTGVWVVQQAPGTVTLINPQSNRTAGAVHVGALPRLAAVGDHGDLWVTVYGDNQLVRVDPVRRRLTGQASMPGACGPQDVAATATAVWVTCYDNNLVLRIDPRSLRISGRVVLPPHVDGTPAQPDGILATASRIWVTDQDGPAVFGLDPASDGVTGRFQLGTAAAPQAHIPVVAAAGRLWVPAFYANRLYRIAPPP